MSSPPPIAERYAAWIDAHRRAVLAVGLLVAVVGAAMSSRLPLRPDLSNLLPPSAKSVRDLRALEKRAQAFGTVFVVVEADDPALRTRAARELEKRLQAMPGDLVGAVVYDDSAARRYFWEHRFLFAPLEDLQDAAAALRQKIRDAKLKANPLYIDLEDEGDEDQGASTDERIEELKKQLDEAEAKADAPDGFVSDDGKMQLVLVRTTFASSDFSHGEVLRGRIEAMLEQLSKELGPGVKLGLTGNIIKSLDERAAVVRGMATAAIVTVLICALALLLYYRAVLPVLASLWSLAIGTLATFAFAWVAIGELNLVTAFLAAIVVGNGINAGLILLARYFEEVRAGREGNAALAGGIRGAARGTLAASLAAGVAYGSLVVTDFRGFRHFGIIGFVGMVMCWIGAFTVLPAGLAVLWRRGRIRAHSAPAVGTVLARILPRRLGVVAVVGGILAFASAVATWRFVANDPLQEDWSNLRPHSSVTREANYWSTQVENRFTTKFQRGLTQRFVIGVPRRDQVPALVKKLRAVDRGRPADQQLLYNVTSLDDLLPDHQQEKLELIAEIRRLLDDKAIKQLDEKDRRLIERVRPPDHIEPLGDDDVPDALAWVFTEKDGTRGRLIIATASLRFKTWNVRHRMEFAAGFRKLELPEGTVVGGQSFVFADLVEAMRRDGPLATGVAVIGSVLVVLLLLGLRRHGLVTLGCAFTGVLGMIALVSLFGLKVNVIDFIALPITIGLGVDYAVNIAARERQDGSRGPRYVLATTGGAVLLCSFTTIVGYGSLLISDSGGIRSFGLAAILGELACVTAALALAPTLLSLLRRRAGDDSDDSEVSSADE